MAVINISDCIYYISGPTNIGIIEERLSDTKSNLYMIDSGCNTEDGKRIFTEITEYFSQKDITIKAIINTHSHADHCGANNYIQQKTNCEIWITENEQGSLINPFLQPIISWGGNPLPEINSSYYVAEKTVPNKIINTNEKLTLLNGIKISFINLPGHYFEMIGILCEDNNKKVLFASDGIFGRKNIGKYWIPFLYDVKEFKNSLDTISSLNADFCIPGHGEPTSQIEETVELNKIAIISNEQCILEALKYKEQTQEDILKYVADKNEINLHIAQYMLIGCTIKAYLTFLYNEGKISYHIKENKMYWFKTES
ncbi:MAG: MBL fold metallo-hydrolase [Treponema sp.]|nr:MBL fold metallo-hydrolase [Treponema sp.]MBQ5877074.1 MBL fold metallo-hydrolase [Treponema sp.]